MDFQIRIWKIRSLNSLTNRSRVVAEINKFNLKVTIYSIRCQAFHSLFHGLVINIKQMKITLRAKFCGYYCVQKDMEFHPVLLFQNGASSFFLFQNGTSSIFLFQNGTSPTEASSDDDALPAVAFGSYELNIPSQVCLWQATPRPPNSAQVRVSSAKYSDICRTLLLDVFTFG